MDYKGKKIIVLGAGTSGVGAARVLARLGAETVLADRNDKAVSDAERDELTGLGVTVITGRQDEAMLDGVHRVIVSPGIPLTIPFLESARQKGIDIVGEVELGYEVCKAPMLAVTGTNGKTTVTTLLAKVMELTGKNILVGGNIGDSLSEQALAATADSLVVAEVSSYQLESVKTFRPQGAIVLNVTPDHLQRHKTMAAYAAAKANIFRCQRAGDFTVLNVDDPIVKAMAPNVPAKVLCISQHGTVTDGAYFSEGICYAVRAGQAVPVVTASDLLIPGQHNIENVLAVIALAYALGVDVEAMGNTIRHFSGVEHRIEKTAVIDGVTYYNDSKATNTDSAIKALEAFTVPIILLAGGHDKMTPLADFMAEVKKTVKDLILMGEAADRFEKAARDAGITAIHRAGSMAEAVRMGQQLASPGDVVLLSPACSSFDWYSCFEERGDDFKENVRKLMK